MGKTTLLRYLALADDLELQVLHVRQEVPTTTNETVVLDAVLEANQERNELLQREQEIEAILEENNDDETTTDNNTDNEALVKELQQIQARLQEEFQNSPARAGRILAGLQFTPAMQAGPMGALSGGWKMRVALAAALFIEPQLLLLVSRLA